MLSSARRSPNPEGISLLAAMPAVMIFIPDNKLR
jgi:hypothetical protein